jgi:hypothetical protein
LIAADGRHTCYCNRRDSLTAVRVKAVLHFRVSQAVSLATVAGRMSRPRACPDGPRLAGAGEAIG